MKRILIFTDQPPYPPRNGMTTTVFNYIEHLSRNHQAHVVVLTGGHALETEGLADSRSYYGKRMTEIAFKRRGPIPRAIRELLGLELFQHGWRLGDGRRPDDVLPQADAHLIAPESAAQKYRRLKLPPPARTVVSINDCVTAEYRYRGKQYGGNALRRLRSRLDWLRSFRIAGIERRLLAFADVVCLQTESDCTHYRHCVGSHDRPAIRTLSNGPCPDLFSIPADYADRNDILFIADLSSEHGHWLVWFLEEVYPRIEQDAGFNRLVVVGRSPSEKQKNLMARCRKVEYRGYVEHLADVYRHTRLVLSLVYKGYGLITKTLDGMAAGCIVIGGDGAFHGLQGFEDRTHGFVVDKGDASGMAALIRRCFEPDADLAHIGRKARELVGGQFRWDDTFGKLEALLLLLS